MIAHRCSRCGAVEQAPADGMPAAWSIHVDGGERRLLCASCTRDHARDIEGKLDEAWWT